MHYERDLKIETLPNSGRLIVTSELVWKQSIVLYKQQFPPISPGEDQKLSLILRTDPVEDLTKQSIRNPTDPLMIRLTVNDGQFCWKTDIGPYKIVSRVKRKESAGKVKKEFKTLPFRKQQQFPVQISFGPPQPLTTAPSFFQQDPVIQSDSAKRRIETVPEGANKRRRVEKTTSGEGDKRSMSLILDKLDVLEDLQRKMLMRVDTESQVTSPIAMTPTSDVSPSASSVAGESIEFDMFPEGFYFPDDLFDDLAQENS